MLELSCNPCTFLYTKALHSPRRARGSLYLRAQGLELFSPRAPPFAKLLGLKQLDPDAHEFKLKRRTV